MMIWKHALAIVNPKAGRWRSEKAAPRLLTDAFATHHGTVTIRTVSGSQDARTWAAHAAAEGFDLVIVCGGDGTINETVNGLAYGGRLPIAVLPTGSGNVLASELGIPRRLNNAIACIHDGTTVDLDVGEATSHGSRFVIAVTLGYGSNIVADARAELKNLLGNTAYALTALKQLIRIKTASFRCVLDGAERRFDAQMVMVANVPFESLRLGTIGPAVSPSDGRLDVIVFSHKNVQELIATIAEMVRKPDQKPPGVTSFQARTVELESTPALPLDIDGDRVDGGTVKVEIRPGELQVVVPKK